MPSFFIFPPIPPPTLVSSKCRRHRCMKYKAAAISLLTELEICFFSGSGDQFTPSKSTQYTGDGQALFLCCTCRASCSHVISISCKSQFRFNFCLLLHGLFCTSSSGSVYVEVRSQLYVLWPHFPPWVVPPAHPSLGIRRRRGIRHKHPATCGIMCWDPH